MGQWALTRLARLCWLVQLQRPWSWAEGCGEGRGNMAALSADTAMGMTLTVCVGDAAVEMLGIRLVGTDGAKRGGDGEVDRPCLGVVLYRFRGLQDVPGKLALSMGRFEEDARR